MEFWGVEVKSGEPFMVNPGEGKVLHLSQACLGEVKKEKANESVCIFVNIDDKKLVLGTLSPEKLPQQVFDLVFDKEFQLSHNWKNGSVYFYGYKAPNPFDDESEDEFDSEDDIPLQFENSGGRETQVKEVKHSAPPAANAVKDSVGKQKVKIAEPKKDKPEKDEDSEDSEDSEEESDSDDPMSADESDSDEGDESSEDDDEDSDEEDETPKKVESNKKRPNELATKTPRPDKKAKLVTPKKTGTDGKKGGAHVDTPHPSKQAVKTPANNKSNQKTPKSEGSHTCKPCNRSFKTEGALDSHTKAKHSAGK